MATVRASDKTKSKLTELNARLYEVVAPNCALRHSPQFKLITDYNDQTCALRRPLKPQRLRSSQSIQPPASAAAMAPAAPTALPYPSRARALALTRRLIAIRN